jgi:hypothetical protein
MSPMVIGVITFLCVLGGTLIGMFIRKTLPEQHLSGDSKDAVRIGMGLIATLCALVLSLLLSSAKDSFDEMSSAVAQSGAKFILLDRTMANYGPETQPIRQKLRLMIIERVKLIWPEHKTSTYGADAFEKSPSAEVIAAKLRELTPKTDLQRTFQSEALQLCREIVQMRWMIIEQSQASLPPVFLAVLLFWLAILFGSIGLFAPPNKTVLAVMVVCAISVGGAIFLIEEMNNPLGGIVKISSAPLINALENMGK